jgi:secreted PhoX family phosphatase
VKLYDFGPRFLDRYEARYRIAGAWEVWRFEPDGTAEYHGADLSGRDLPSTVQDVTYSDAAPDAVRRAAEEVGLTYYARGEDSEAVSV